MKLTLMDRRQEKRENDQGQEGGEMKPRDILLGIVAVLMGLSLVVRFGTQHSIKAVRKDLDENTKGIRLLIPKTANLYFQLGVYCGSQVKGMHPEYDQFEIDKAALQKAKEVAPSDEYLKGDLMPIKSPTNGIVVRDNVFIMGDTNAFFKFLIQ